MLFDFNELTYPSCFGTECAAIRRRTREVPMLNSMPAEVMIIVFLVILMAIVDRLFRLIEEIHKHKSQEPD